LSTLTEQAHLYFLHKMIYNIGMNRNEQKKATALKIMTSAKELFSEQGYDTTNTRQIAKHAGVGVGTVFSHFKDKHQLTKALFFGELEKQLTLNKAIIDQGGLIFFSTQTKLLFHFYDGNRDLSKAFLQNALFERDFFSEQLEGFILTISGLLTVDLPNHSEQQRIILSKAWVGFYFNELLRGLSDPKSTVTTWHQTLMLQCQQLLTMLMKK
jgi:AcrR family transcriptional regulator